MYKKQCVCFNEVIRLMTMKIKLKMKYRSYRYKVNGCNTYATFEAQFMKKLSNTEVELKKTGC